MNNKGKTWMEITPNDTWEEWEKRFSPCWNDKDKEWVSKQISEVEKNLREKLYYEVANIDNRTMGETRILDKALTVIDPSMVIGEQSHISDCECPPFNHAEEEKKAMINEVIKETNADQRLVMYKADLIRELEGMYFIEAQGIDELMAAHNGAIYEVIQIIKK